MKTFFFFIALSFSSLAFSQGNLQFNQVKRISYQNQSIPYYTWTNLGSLNVPTGTVWKIESSSIIMEGNTVYMLAVDGQVICTGINSNAEWKINSISPVWLPSGTYSITVLHNNSGGGPVTMKEVKISAIEFNIIP